MAYNFLQFKSRGEQVVEWLAREYSNIRTGRAAPIVLDQVQVEVYGARQPIKHVANINVENSRTLRVSPWDKSQIKALETAILSANLGLQAIVDGEGLRVVFPELTGERREQFIKIIKVKLEEAKVSLRKEREKTWNDIVAKEENGDITEDEKFRAKEDLQKGVDAINGKLETLAEKKEVELRS